jgi:cysteine desulfurase
VPGADLVYLDHAATTPMRPEAVAAMLPHLAESFANPSGSHRFAREARRVVDDAREVVADVIGCAPGEVVFTGCGTESDNTAIAGVLAAAGGGRAVCPAAEHHAVLHSVQHARGTVVTVDPLGRVDLDALADALDDDVRVVSVMAVNNEVGSVTDLAPVAELVRTRSPLAVLHTDAVQAPSWLDLRAVWPHVDLLALSAHKFGGPKGVGVLAVRHGTRVEPLLRGGGQERDRRSGTHNVAGIAACAEALRLTALERPAEVARLASLRDRLVDALVAADDCVVETVPRSAKVAGSAHVCIDGLESEALLYLLDEAGVCASAASACASGAMEPSHVLAAMGVPRRRALGALRLTLGRTTTAADVDRAADVIADAIGRLRRAMARAR